MGILLIQVRTTEPLELCTHNIHHHHHQQQQQQQFKSPYNVKLHFVFTNKTRYFCYVLLLTKWIVCLGQNCCDKTSRLQSYNAQ